MTVNELREFLTGVPDDSDVLLIFPFRKGRLIVKDIESVRTKAIDGTVIMLAGQASSVQADDMLKEVTE